MQPNESQLLKNAFQEFVKASDSLSTYYEALEDQINQLNNEISEKNRELEKSKEHFYNILNSLPVGVVVRDSKASAVFTNKEAQRFGWWELTGKLDEDPGNRLGEVKSDRGYFRWKKSLLDSGSEGREVVVFEDFTEIQKMKERSERDERLRAMGEMAARIAHEVKNPLGSMKLYLSMMLKGKLGDKEREFTNAVVFGMNTIDRIINNLLSYTRPKTIVLKQRRLAHVVKEILDFMSISISGRQIEVVFNNSFDEESWFDPDLLKLGLMNFISNAIEAIDNNGILTVNIKEAGPYAIVVFSDTGSGMNEETRKNIFNPFFTTKDKGVGLGLFITHNIVKAHNGYIEVESVEGSGSTFIVFLPKEKS
jgi:two-component system, sensor histidine kinase FlrB